MDFTHAEKGIEVYLQHNQNEVMSRLLQLLRGARNLDSHTQIESILAFMNDEQVNSHKSPEKARDYAKANEVFMPYLQSAIAAESNPGNVKPTPTTAKQGQMQAPTTIKAKINAASPKTVKTRDHGPSEKFLGRNIASIIFTLLFIAAVFFGGMYVNGEIEIDSDGLRFIGRIIPEYGDEDIFFVSVNRDRGLDVYGNLWDISNLGDENRPPTIILEGLSFSRFAWPYGIDTSGNLWLLRDSSVIRDYIGITDGREVPFVIMEGTTFRDIFIITSRTFATDTSGNTWVWGSGQLGDGADTNSTVTPIQILPGVAFQSVASNAHISGITHEEIHTVAVDTEGNLWGWGNNETGQLGDGTTQSRISPVRIETEATFTHVFADRMILRGSMSDYTWALDTNGNFWAWGAYKGGQWGYATTPTMVTEIGVNVASISRSFILDISGNIWFNDLSSDATNEGEYVLTRINARPNFVYLSSNLLICTDGMLWQIEYNRANRSYIVRRLGR